MCQQNNQGETERNALCPAHPNGFHNVARCSFDVSDSRVLEHRDSNDQAKTAGTGVRLLVDHTGNFRFKHWQDQKFRGQRNVTLASIEEEVREMSYLRSVLLVV